MTYGQFLLVFLAIPILGLLALNWRRLSRKRWLSLLALMGLALIYTTPWDNYLVANQVWWYDPGKVSGIVFGYVPIEEYAFFLLQPLMTGLLLLALRDRQQATATGEGSAPRFSFLLPVGMIWLLSLGLLAFGPNQSRYLSLELAWALPPLMLQLAFGADLILASWRPSLSGWLLATGYLIAADMWAISQGIWTISPDQTLGLNPLPALVLEEAVFFLLTNALVIGGLTLLDEPVALARLQRWGKQLGLPV